MIGRKDTGEKERVSEYWAQRVDTSLARLDELQARAVRIRRVRPWLYYIARGDLRKGSEEKPAHGMTIPISVFTSAGN